MHNNTRQLILGSTSQPRADLLRRLLIPFEIAAPDIDETALENETPEQLVVRLAKEKAQAVAVKYPDALIIGADQVGVLNGKIVGKPLTYENCITQLQAASGQRMDFFIGVCLLDARHKTEEIVLEKFTVIFRELTIDMIKNYLRKEEPFQCAGSCKGEGLGIALIAEFIGEDYTALVGLPLIRLVQMLEHAGIDPLAY
ncbi:MAG: Maf family protein [Gammaproteobacteria bacterium]|nr:Maf family protein [Gammaproteobacteria bacterium]